MGNTPLSRAMVHDFQHFFCSTCCLRRSCWLSSAYARRLSSICLYSLCNCCKSCTRCMSPSAGAPPPDRDIAVAISTKKPHQRKGDYRASLSLSPSSSTQNLQPFQIIYHRKMFLFVKLCSCSLISPLIALLL